MANAIINIHIQMECPEKATCISCKVLHIVYCIGQKNFFLHVQSIGDLRVLVDL